MAGSPERVYLDASVLLSFHVEDAFSARADALLGRRATVFIVSDLCIAEVSSAIARKARTGELTSEEATLAFARIDEWIAKAAEIAIQTPEDLREANRLIRLMTLSLRTQDAVHAAIAKRLRAPLATFDSTLAKSASGAGFELTEA
jgi:uncharacterized protein